MNTPPNWLAPFVRSLSSMVESQSPVQFKASGGPGEIQVTAFPAVIETEDGLRTTVAGFDFSGILGLFDVGAQITYTGNGEAVIQGSFIGHRIRLDLLPDPPLSTKPILQYKNGKLTKLTKLVKISGSSTLN